MSAMATAKASTFLYGTKGSSASQVRHSLLNELDITWQANGTASPFKMLCSRPTRYANTPSVPARGKAGTGGSLILRPAYST